MTALTLGSLFDGIGVFPLAAQRNGITPLWASEISPPAISITKRHFPQMAHLGSITELTGGARLHRQLGTGEADTKVDRAIATELIDSIFVHEVILADGKRGFELTINYRFVGNLDTTKKDIA